MIYIIDHRDSFTWNVVHQLAPYAEVSVLDADELDKADFGQLDLLVFSPGPGEPADYPKSIDLYHAYKQRVPILGVCLGFQMILFAEGAYIVPQERVLHGVQSPVKFNENCIAYKEMNAPLRVGRYHSLQVEKETLPKDFNITAWDQDTGTPLSFEHSNLPIFGFQYHPDSFLTEHGKFIIDNIFSNLELRSRSS